MSPPTPISPLSLLNRGISSLNSGLRSTSYFRRPLEYSREHTVRQSSSTAVIKVLARLALTMDRHESCRCRRPFSRQVVFSRQTLLCCWPFLERLKHINYQHKQITSLRQKRIRSQERNVASPPPFIFELEDCFGGVVFTTVRVPPI